MLKLFKYFRLFLLLVAGTCWQLPPTLATNSCGPGGSPWKAGERDDLCCRSGCDVKHTSDQTDHEYDKCCTCDSYTTWENKAQPLHLEFFSVTGLSLVIDQDQFDQNAVYVVELRNSYMTSIPSNVCNWDKSSDFLDIYDNDLVNMTKYWQNVVRLDFLWNNIRQLPDINCLTNLDTLYLAHNAITSLKNDSFNTLTKLRKLDIAHNSIKEMDSYVISQPTLSILNVDLGNNKLEQLDVTNAMSLKPFCSIDYSLNKIQNFVNPSGFTLDPTKHYGPGFVHLRNNSIEQWPDFVSLLHLKDLTQMGQLIEFGFDLVGIKLKCDCYLEPFSELIRDLQESLWLDYFAVQCNSPENLQGRNASSVNSSELVCNLTLSEGCPKDCVCIDQPFNNTVFVDCSYLGLQNMPSELPVSTFSNKTLLNVSNNQIKELPNATYLRSLNVLDLNTNFINNIDNEKALLLENATLILSNNTFLRKIPSNFKYRSTCDIKMDQLVLDCTCDMTWIEPWLSTMQCEHAKLFECFVPNHGLINATKFSSSMLECGPDTTTFLVLIVSIISIIVLLVVIGAMFYIFWYELLILCLIIRQKPIYLRHAEFDFDAAITFNEEDDGLRKWVSTVLGKELSRDGYNVFLPYKDTLYGTERDSEIIDVFNKTKTFVLVLSESYFQEMENNDRSWTENEWKYAWNQFKSNPKKNMVVVNYDYISSFDVPHRQIAAFLRVGNVIQFGNHENNIVSEVKTHIGSPRGIVQNSKGLENTKPVFTGHLKSQFKNQKVVPYIELSDNGSEYTTSSAASFNDIFLASSWKDEDSLKDEKIHTNKPSIPFSVCPRRLANEKLKFVRPCCAHKILNHSK